MYIHVHVRSGVYRISERGVFTRNFAHAQILGRCGFAREYGRNTVRVKKNVSKNVRYRFVKRDLPSGFVAVFDSRAVRF